MNQDSKLTKAIMLQRIVQEYRDAGEPWPIDRKSIASWAIRNKRWSAPFKTLIDQCAQELARAMRLEVFVDPQGRRVRRKHAVPVLLELSDGTHEQLYFWHDITDWTREQAQTGFQYLRSHILGDCKRLVTDVESYNDNWNKSGVPVQMCLNFEDDIEEWKHAQSTEEE